MPREVVLDTARRGPVDPSTSLHLSRKPPSPIASGSCTEAQPIKAVYNKVNLVNFPVRRTSLIDARSRNIRGSRIDPLKTTQPNGSRPIDGVIASHSSGPRRTLLFPSHRRDRYPVIAKRLPIRAARRAAEVASVTGQEANKSLPQIERGIAPRDETRAAQPPQLAATKSEPAPRTLPRSRESTRAISPTTSGSGYEGL